MKKIMNYIVIMLMLVVSVQATDLSDYPSMFIKDGKLNGQIVVGANAPASHTLAALDIAQGLKYTEDGAGIGGIVLDSEADVFKNNLIVIGNGCHNDVATILEGFPVACDKNEDLGSGRIQYIESNGYHHIIVSGQDDMELRRAARILYDYNEHVLASDQVFIGGNDFTDIFVRGLEQAPSVDKLKADISMNVQGPRAPAETFVKCNVYGGEAPYDVSVVVNSDNSDKKRYTANKKDGFYVASFSLDKGNHEINCEADDDDGRYAVSNVKYANIYKSELVSETSPRNMQSEPIYGDKNAPITIISYVGYNDPFTVRGFEVLDDILDDFEDDVNVEIRNFPLSFQDKKYIEAQASECALALTSENTFLKYIDNLMDSSDGDVDSVVREAAKLGINDIEMIKCLSDEKFLPEVLDDIKNGERDGVTGTPSFFINGQKISGAQSYEVFAKIIKEELGNDYEVPTEYPSCYDGIRNQGERGIDCDGPCSRCVQDSVPTCRDGIQNQDETSIDCGGSCQTCETQDDCSYGCNIENTCVDLGFRTLVDGDSMYCSITGDLVEQADVGQSCQNNFECQSNQCSNGQCIDLQQELKETRNIIEKLFDWLDNLF